MVFIIYGELLSKYNGGVAAFHERKTHFEK